MNPGTILRSVEPGAGRRQNTVGAHGIYDHSGNILKLKISGAAQLLPREAVIFRLEDAAAMNLVDIKETLSSAGINDIEI